MKKKLTAILLAVCMIISMIPAVLAADAAFTDVNANDWFAESVEYVYDNGLMLGVGHNKFDPNGYVTRAMMWTILARMDGVDTTGNPWWKAGQAWAMEEGISDGTMVENNITREQMVTMLWRYAKYVGQDVSVGEDTNILSYSDAQDVSDWAVSAMQWACGTGIINGISGALQPQGYATRAQIATILFRFGTADPCSSGHAWGEWVSNDDGTHTRVCGTNAAHTETEDCTFAEGSDICVCGYDRTAVARIGDTYYATLEAAIATATDATPVEIVIFATGENTLTTNIKIDGGRNITLRGATGEAADVQLNGQIATTSSTAGTLTIKDLTIFVDDAIVDSTGISQTSKSAIAVWGNQTVDCENVVFEMSLKDSTAITGWWDTGVGTTINATDCVFNCNGQRPLRSCGNMTVEGCTFNDPYRYAIQLTAKASTATELENAVVNFNNNTIINGENGKSFVYGIQLEGGSYGCSNLIINGSGNTIVDGGADSTMYYCECGKVDHATVVWNTEAAAKHECVVSNADELAAAVAAGHTNIWLNDGEYDVKSCDGKTLTLSGTKNAVLKVMNEGEDGCDYGFGHGSIGNVTFNGLTIDTTANTGNYKGYAYMKGTFNNCNFVGAYSLNNANDFVFNNCTFDFKNGYFWTWGANSATFNDCTFNGNSKAILAHGWASTVITIDDCTFAATEKGYASGGTVWTAAIEIDPAGTNTYTINITDSTINENYAGWTRIKDSSTGHVITLDGQAQ